METTSLAAIPDQLLVVPDSFKGTFGSDEVGERIAAGARREGFEVRVMGGADGGEGTADVLEPALGLRWLLGAAHDPLGRELESRFGLGRDGRVAVVEVAAASGFALVSESERDPVGASSYGTGELLVAAARAGAREILVAAGGSATSDGGAGALAAVAEAGGLGEARVKVLCDVRTVFEQAAIVFGPQKGADPEQVRELTARLERFAGELASGGRDPRGVAMSGAAGGLAGGLWAGLGAELVGGARFVLDAIGFDGEMRRSLAVITGEGRIDRQSLAGKLVGEVATRARQAGVPCHAVVGSNALEPFDARILDLQLIVEAGTLADLEAAGAAIAKAITAQRAQGR